MHSARKSITWVKFGPRTLYLLRKFIEQEQRRSLQVEDSQTEQCRGKRLDS